jgi:phage terminase small subunit
MKPAKGKKKVPGQPKNKLFIEEYLSNGLNATKAYKAIYHAKNDNVARASAAQLLAKPKVAEAIKERIDQILGDKAELTMKTIEELKRIAFADITEFLSYDNNSVTFNPSEDVDTRPIESVEITRLKTITAEDGKDLVTEKMKLKLHDKKGALESLCKYLGLFKEKVELSGSTIVYLDRQDAGL